MIGTDFEGRYRVDAELGAGGVGAVYRATHLKLGRPVALKVLQGKYGASTELRRRFEREAKALAALSHPNIVTVTDYGLSGGAPYLVMELLEGKTLGQRLEAGPLEPDEAFDVARQLLRALAFIHAQGLVHRDLKPANVFLQAVPGARPHVKILDFGLAKFCAPEAGAPAITRAGQVFGTPAYMAPEQVAGQETDASTDVYAAGILLFEMLAGEAPFRGSTSELMRQHLVEPLPEVSDLCPSRRISEELRALLVQATAKRRAERFRDAGEMAAALDGLPQPAVLDGGAQDAAELAASPPRTAPRPSGELTVEAAAEVEDAEEGPRSGSKDGGARSAGARVLRAGALLVVALSLAAILVAGAIIYALRTSDHPEQRAALDEGLQKLIAEGKAVAKSGLGGPGGAPDPWKSPPPELVSARSAVDGGQTLSKETIAFLHEYNAEHLADARGHLLLARSHLNRGWHRDAAKEYTRAYRRDPGIRGDPRMLDDLLTLVAFGSEVAEELVREAYGEAAAGAVEHALSKPLPNPAAGQRLRRLREAVYRRDR